LSRRVVITGLGVVSPIGTGVEKFWKNLTAGVSGIDIIKGFDPVEDRSKRSHSGRGQRL
jgi:3-oxoacyl-[acyl-carrier-protein] synthase II